MPTFGYAKPFTLKKIVMVEVKVFFCPYMALIMDGGEVIILDQN